MIAPYLLAIYAAGVLAWYELVFAPAVSEDQLTSKGAKVCAALWPVWLMGAVMLVCIELVDRIARRRRS